jgi:transcriptional regulator with XRE-family HTH domain
MNQTDTRLMPDRLDVAIGAAVRLRRKAINVSQGELAEACGVTFQQVQKYENGTTRISFSRLVQVAHALECRVSTLIGDIDRTEGFTEIEAEMMTRQAIHGADEMLRIYEQLDTVTRRRFLELMRAFGDRKG